MPLTAAPATAPTSLSSTSVPARLGAAPGVRHDETSLVVDNARFTCPVDEECWACRAGEVTASTNRQAAPGWTVPRTPVDRLGEVRRGLRTRPTGDGAVAQFVRFVLVGGAATGLYGVLLVVLDDAGTQSANLVGALASSMLATELHRRLTFHAGGRINWSTAQWQGAGLTLAGMVATSLALSWFDSHPGPTGGAVHLVVVTAVTGLVGLVRFVALRWAFAVRPSRVA